MAAANPLNWHHVEQMAEYCRANRRWRDLLIILIPCTSGYRHSDWAELKWVDALGKDSIKKVEQKTDKHRTAPLNAYVKAAILQAYEGILATIPPSKRGAMKNDYIFKPESHNSKSGVMTRAGVNSVLDRIRIAVGIEHTVTVHSLRKAYGMRLYGLMGETESAMIWVSNWFGHSSLQVTQRYLGLEAKLKMEVMDQMWANG